MAARQPVHPKRPGNTHYDPQRRQHAHRPAHRHLPVFTDVHGIVRLHLPPRSLLLRRLDHRSSDPVSTHRRRGKRCDGTDHGRIEVVGCDTAAVWAGAGKRGILP